MNFRLILLLAAFVGLVLAVACLAAGQNGEQKSNAEPSTRNSQRKVMDFEYFRHKYNKHYANAAELARRAKLFMARAFSVFLNNMKYALKRSTKLLKITSRSDWTQEERDAITTDDRQMKAHERQRRNADSSAPQPAYSFYYDDDQPDPMGSVSDFFDAKFNKPKKATSDVADKVFLDYRDTGCLPPAKDQKRCGSCYAFTATALMEYHHCKQSGKLLPFSEQYVIDCGADRLRGSLKGCDGGTAEYAAIFAEDYGLELAADYPYVGKDLACPYPSSVDDAQMGFCRVDKVQLISTYNRDGELGPQTIQKLLEDKGPLAIALKTSWDFDDFAGGVDQLRCQPERGGHAMVLIGHGVENGIEYWLIRNSHGIEFGVEGHYKVAKDIPSECLTRVAYFSGNFSENNNHKGTSLFELTKAGGYIESV